MYLELRHRAKQIIRHYFDEQAFIEVDSSILIPSNAIEAYVDPIWVGDQELRTSPEISLKRLLARGYTKIYELGHVFRDEIPGRLHEPEFMLLEWYRVGANLSDLIQDCENIFSALDPDLFLRPFEVKTLQELWLKYAKIDLRRALLEDNLVNWVQKAGFLLRGNANFEDAFHHVMLTAIEPVIGRERPCVVTRWPRQMAALSRLCKDDNLFAERFEIYFKQVELANAFAELTDPAEQVQRFEKETQIRQFLGKKSSSIDKNFISDLALIPPTSGIAVGFDRVFLLMIQKIIKKDLNLKQICRYG